MVTTAIGSGAPRAAAIRHALATVVTPMAASGTGCTATER